MDDTDRAVNRRLVVKGAAAGLASLAWPALASCTSDASTGAVPAAGSTPTPTPAPTSEALVAAAVGAATASYHAAPTGLSQTENDGRWYSLSAGVLDRYQRLAVPTVGQPAEREWSWTWELTDSVDLGWEYEQLVALGHGVLIGRSPSGALQWHRDLSVGRNPIAWSINDGRVIAEGWQLAHLLALHSGHLLAVDADGATWWHQWLGDRWHPASGSVQVATDWVFDNASAAGATIFTSAAGVVQARTVTLPKFLAADAAPRAEVSAPTTVEIGTDDSRDLVALDDDSLLVAAAGPEGGWHHVHLSPGVTPQAVELPMDAAVPAALHAVGGPVDLRHLDRESDGDAIAVDAYWQEQSVSRRDMAALAVSTPTAGRVRIEVWDLAGPALVASQHANTQNQGVPALALSNGCGWSTIRVPLPDEASSGLYAAAVAPVEDGADTTPAEWARDTALYVPLVVRPRAEDTAPLAVLANTNTWNAYNAWGGASQYTNPFATRLSFRRPNRSLDPTRVLGTVAGDDLAAPNHHLVAGEVRFLTWLRDQGFDWHSWSDADLHGGALDLNRYRALVIHSHPEYWTTDMFDRVSRWLDDGGTLVNLGANGIYERVELTSDADGSRTMVLRNGHPEGERDLIRFSDRPERSLLGVAFEGVLHDGDPPELQKGTATDRYAPYRVVGSEHPFFADTGLSDGDLFVTVDGEVGGAGWEVDTSYFDGHEASGGPAPDNLQLLARGTLGERPGEEGLWTPDYNAHMTYYDHPGGGWVFSAGSMVFTHWMVEDPAAAQLIRNVLDAAVEP